MAVPSMATNGRLLVAPRQRRRNHHHSQWTTPLPLSAAVPRNKRRNAASNTGAVVLCASFLCMVVFFGAMFSTTLPSFLPEHRGSRAGKLLSGRRHKLKNMSQSGSVAGTGQEAASQPRPIAYVDLSALPSSHQYDVVIVGCGPAGLSAALFASRMGLSVLVCGSPSAGALAGTDTLDNYPSFLGIGGDGSGGGQGWVDAAVGQASSFGAEFAPPSLLATGLAKVTVQQNDILEVHLGDKKVHGKSVIVASGSTPRRLDLPHEGALWGRSLHSCALCDGDIYAGKDGSKKSVVVVGGGDAAVEAIFLLHKLGAGTIHWIHRREEYNASAVEVGRAKQLANVEVWTPFVVAEWMVKKSSRGNGEDDPALQIEGVRIVGAKDGAADPDAASSLTIPCDGVFLMIGSTPNSDWLRGSGMDIDLSTKLIRTVPSLRADQSDNGRKDNNPPPQLSTATSIDGVFAAGEVVDELYRQALTASAEGAKAAIDAQRYLRHMGLETGLISQASDTKKEAVARKESQISHSKEAEGVAAGPVDCDLTKVECIQRLVASHPVVVFSKHYCPYCRRALEALRSFAEPIVLDLTEMRNGYEVQDALASMTGRRTVPNVFVGGRSIGGGDETTALYREGKLEGMLRDAGAI